MGVSGTVPYAHEIGSLFHHIGRAFHTVGRHAFRLKGDRHILAPAGRKLFCLCIACQLLIRFVKIALRCGIIYLYNFLSGLIAGIFNRSGYRYLFRISGHALWLYRKGRISGAVAERIGRHMADCVKIAVAHIDAFLIICIVGVAKAFRGGIILNRRPGHGQLTRRVCFSQHHIRQRVPGSHSKLSHQQNRGNLFHRF